MPSAELGAPAGRAPGAPRALRRREPPRSRRRSDPPSDRRAGARADEDHAVLVNTARGTLVDSTALRKRARGRRDRRRGARRVRERARRPAGAPRRAALRPLPHIGSATHTSRDGMADAGSAKRDRGAEGERAARIPFIEPLALDRDAPRGRADARPAGDGRAARRRAAPSRPLPDPAWRSAVPRSRLVPGAPEVELDPDLVLLILLPPILYAAAFFTPLRELAPERRGDLAARGRARPGDDGRRRGRRALRRSASTGRPRSSSARSSPPPTPSPRPRSAASSACRTASSRSSRARA